MTDKEIQASDEEMKHFNISQNEKCVLAEEKIKDLKSQIEKKKCCENCEHNGSDNEIGENGDYTDYTCIQCDDLSTKENPYPNWEKAE